VSKYYCPTTNYRKKFFDILEENKKREEKATEAVRVSGGKSSRMVAKGPCGEESK